MNFKLVLATLAALVASNVVLADEGDVYTAQKVYQTLDSNGHLTRTSTPVVWTQGPSITDPSATVIPTEIDETSVYGDDEPLPTLP